MTPKEVVHPDQYSLFSGDDEIRSLISVPIPGAELLATRIRKDRLWPQDGSNPNGAFIDWHSENDEIIAFDARTLEIHPHSEEKRFSVIAISTPAMDTLSDERSPQLVTSVTKLRKNGVLYVLEPIGLNIDPVWRKNALDDIGLVDRSVVHLPGNYLLWRGRLPKEHPRHTIDLIENWRNSDEQWKHNRLHKIASDVKKRYEDAGLKVISWDKITAHLHATTNPRAAIRFLEAGGGVRLQSNCGCEWETVLSGDMHNVHVGCDEHTSRSPYTNPLVQQDGQSHALTIRNNTNVHKTENKPYYVMGRPIELREVCSDCGSHFVEESRIIKKIRGGRVKIITEKRCPHDGLIETSYSTLRFDQLSE